MAKDKMKEIFDELRDSKRKQDIIRNFQSILVCFAENNQQSLSNIFAIQNNKMNFLKCYYDLSNEAQNNIQDIIQNSNTNIFKDELLEVLNDRTTKDMHYVVKFCDFFIENRIPKAKEEMLNLYNNEEKQDSFKKGVKGILHAIHNKVNDYGYNEIIDNFSKKIAQYIPVLKDIKNEPNKETYLKVLNKIEYGINLAKSYDNLLNMMMPPVFASFLNPFSNEQLPKKVQPLKSRR